MTKRQLKALESLPDVIEALESLGRDAEKLRAAMARAAGLGVLPQALPIPAPAKPAPAEVSPSPVMLPTPERAEYEAMRRAGTQNYNPEAEETPDKKRQRELLESFRKSQARQVKLQQFPHDGGGEEVAQ